MLIHLVFIALWSICNDSHFTDEETEAQRLKEACPVWYRVVNVSAEIGTKSALLTTRIYCLKYGNLVLGNLLVGFP